VTVALSTDETLLALKIGFLVLLYLFIWLVVRSATRDLRTSPQESIVVPAAEAARLRAQLAPTPGRLRVQSSPVLRRGSTIDVAGQTRIGRGPENVVRLDGDDFVSSRHALVETNGDGLWVEDVGSTNGTFVNGARLTSRRLLQTGDVVRIGRTDLEVVT
jgi:pSer/pThr/pTyr-binding forkhead associated (FHA) protein